MLKATEIYSFDLSVALDATDGIGVYRIANGAFYWIVPLALIAETCRHSIALVAATDR